MHQPKRLLFTTAIALGLLHAILVLLASNSADLGLSSRVFASSLLYVAPGGVDTGACLNSASPCASIQYAVDQAAPSDEIRVAAGHYSDYHVRPRKDISATGVVTQVVYIEKSVVVRGGYTTTNWTTFDPTANPTIVDAQSMGRGFYVTGYISPTIEGFQITGGNALGLGGERLADIGSGLYIITASALISNNLIFSNGLSLNSGFVGGGIGIESANSVVQGNSIVGNISAYAGGIYIYHGTDVVQSNVISGNLATQSRGGAFFRSGLTQIFNNQFINNQVTSFGGYAGGVGMQAFHGRFEGNLIQGNNATSGGGLDTGFSQMVFANNTIINNSAGTGGGVMATSDGTLSNNLIAANGGGGIWISSGPVTVTFNIILSNSTSGKGGGILIENTHDVIVNNNFISNNTSGGGGGGIGLDYATSITLTSNVIAKNRYNIGNFISGGGGVDVFGSQAILINNVVIENSTDTAGSGIFLLTAQVSMRHNTISNNTGAEGAGILIGKTSYPSSTVSLINNIVTSQTVGIMAATSDEVVAIDGVLWFNDTSHFSGPVTPTHQVTGPPLFSADGYHLLAGSSAINAGVTSQVAVDIDNESRLAPVDLGADEFTADYQKVYLPSILR